MQTLKLKTFSKKAADFVMIALYPLSLISIITVENCAFAAPTYRLVTPFFMATKRVDLNHHREDRKYFFKSQTVT